MNKITLKISAWLVLFAFSFGAYCTTFAVEKNLEVNWNTGISTQSQNIAPGNTYNKIFSIKNNSEENQKIALKISNLTQNIELADYIDFSFLINSNQVLFESFKSISEKNQETYLSNIIPNETLNCQFNMNLRQDTANELQNKKLGFDFTVGYIAKDGQFNPVGVFRAQPETVSDENQNIDQQDAKKKKPVTEDETKEKGVVGTNYDWIYILIAVALVLFFGLWFALKRSKEEKEEDEK